MVVKLFLAFIAAIGLLGCLWCFFGLLVMPVFRGNMLTVCHIEGDADAAEQIVRGYGWLRDGRRSGGRLLFVDCGLSEKGLILVTKLQHEYPWVAYCPAVSLPDYMELELESVARNSVETEQ